jgi:hypothetical protein
MKIAFNNRALSKFSNQQPSSKREVVEWNERKNTWYRIYEMKRLQNAKRTIHPHIRFNYQRKSKFTAKRHPSVHMFRLNLWLYATRATSHNWPGALRWCSMRHRFVGPPDKHITYVRTFWVDCSKLLSANLQITAHKQYGKCESY